MASAGRKRIPVQRFLKGETALAAEQRGPEECLRARKGNLEGASFCSALLPKVEPMTGAQLGVMLTLNRNSFPSPTLTFRKQHLSGCPGGRRHYLPSVLPTWGQGAGKAHWNNTLEQLKRGRRKVALGQRAFSTHFPCQRLARHRAHKSRNTKYLQRDSHFSYLQVCLYNVDGIRLTEQLG